MAPRRQVKGESGRRGRYDATAMRFTLTAKLLIAFGVLALVAALPGAGLLVGILRLERTTHESHRDLEARDSCSRTRAAAISVLTALQSHQLFPEDSRFVEAAHDNLAAAERALAAATQNLDPAQAEGLAQELGDLDSAAAATLDGPPPDAAHRQALQTAALGFTSQLDHVIAEINLGLARHDTAVADTVHRLSRLGAFGLGTTILAALFLAFSLGTAFRARMVLLRTGVERITRGDLTVRIDDRESDEVGTLARTFNRMAGELQLLEDMKSQFVAVASHELRTPLTLIDGYCGILLSPAKGPLSDWHRERIERIHGQVQELLALVQDLLDAERLQERALAPVLEPFEPQALATGLFRDFETEARSRGLQLSLQVEPSTPRSGQADVRALTRVVRNLLDNAIKYTAAGEIHLSLSGLPGQLILTVTDTGCGIAPEELPRIFQRFYQVTRQVSDASRPRRGFGLGLSIVRGLVERNHGTLETQSTPGSGSTFTVRWPVDARSEQRGAA